METIIRKLQFTESDRDFYREAAAWIHQGEPVAFPTETVYGLGGNGLDPASAARIYAAKGRPSDNPLILHIAEMDEVPALVQDIPAPARRLMETFWPGPLTVILKKSKIVPFETTGGLDTVALRMPSHPAAAALIRAAAVPLAAPSANASGRPSPTCAAHVYQDLKGRIPLILDGGETQIGLESTIVDMSGETPEILRPGYIGTQALRSVLGSVSMDPAATGSGDQALRPRAPGMKYRHYAPRVPMTLLRGEDTLLAEYVLNQARNMPQLRFGAIISEETLGLYRDKKPDNLLLFPLGFRLRDETVAHNLFAVLRSLDEYDLSHVYCESFEAGPLSSAIMNRLKKAAAFQIQEL